jgi:phage terminase small subunit
MKLFKSETFSSVDNKSNEDDSLSAAPEVSIAKWLTNPDDWSRDEFLTETNAYLSGKNGSIDVAEIHLLGILVTQIEVYIESVKMLQTDGLTMTFNNGVTVGPNPHITIADRSLNRILQLMKELELSPKARDGYRSKDGYSPEFKAWLRGP